MGYGVRNVAPLNFDISLIDIIVHAELAMQTRYLAQIIKSLLCCPPRIQPTARGTRYRPNVLE
jgi:hypothetical protein